MKYSAELTKANPSVKHSISNPEGDQWTLLKIDINNICVYMFNINI